MTPSSPASSLPLCIPWAKARQRPQAGPPDTLTAADLCQRARTRRSVGLSRGAPRSYRLEERCVPPAGFSAPRMARREPESPVSCVAAAARTCSRVCQCPDHLRRRASQCTSRGHAARQERALLDQRARADSLRVGRPVGVSKRWLGRAGWRLVDAASALCALDGLALCPLGAVSGAAVSVGRGKCSRGKCGLQ